MAVITITPGNAVAASTNCGFEAVEFGETIGNGDWVYKNPTDGLFYKADANGLLSGRVRGICIIGGAANAIGVIVTRGLVSIGAVVAAGVTYFQSETAAKMSLRTDVVTAGAYITPVGTAPTTSTLQIAITASNVAI